MGARLDGIEEVRGSNPLGSTNLFMAFFVYVLQSESASRVAYHNSNYSKSLKNRGPWGLLYAEEFATRAEAMRRERQIKLWKDCVLIERLVSASR